MHTCASLVVAYCINTQEGSDGKDVAITASALDDGGVVVAGYYNGTSWSGTTSAGETDFAAVKLNSDGTVAWRWQVSK